MISAYANVIRLSLFSALIFMLASCGSSEKTEGAHQKLRVISSFSIITNMVQEIGGDSVIVHNLVPIGTAPHEYEPIPNDLKFASGADLFLYNGLNLEGGKDGWFFRITRSVKADPGKIVEVAKAVTPMYLSEKEGSSEVNPHAFISPHVGILMAEAVREALVSADEGNKDYYIANASAYITRLKEIEAQYKEKLSEIPNKRRVFIASEQAFQYLNAEYGLKEGYIWAIDTEENGSPNQIKRAISFVRQNNPPVLFVESNVDRRPMETVSKESGVPIYSPAIFSDELGKPGQEADSYIKYLEYNLKHIYQGLMSGVEQ